MMRLIIILGCVWLASAGTVPDKCDGDGVFFNGQYYEKEDLKSGLLIPSELAYDKSTDTIFFVYFAYNYINRHYYKSAYLNLKTKEFHDIPALDVYGTSVTIDPTNNDIYFGTIRGIYKYNRDTKEAEFVTAKDVEIYSIRYEDALYYITDHCNQLFRYTVNETKLISEDVCDYIGDVNNEYFLIKNKRNDLYRGVGESNELEHYTPPDTPHETNFKYRGLAKDGNDNVFVYGSHEVYVPNRAEKKLDMVADMTNDYKVSMIFDKDNNVICSNVMNIYKLTRSESHCTPPA